MEMFEDDLIWEEEETVPVDTLGMTPKEKNLADINAIAKEHGYTVEDILGYWRPKELVKVRRLCVVMLREKGYSTLAIGRIMHRDHSSICNSLYKSKAEA
jgi:chromosomal replication initiation ATPase DnaA